MSTRAPALATATADSSRLFRRAWPAAHPAARTLPHLTPPAGRTFAASTRPLSIPRASIAHVLGAALPPDGGGASRRDSMSVTSLGTPRSPLGADAAGSAPTPRASLADEPASPRSPTTPGGRRRRAQKIHGLDYYEFCELVRAGSSM